MQQYFLAAILTIFVIINSWISNFVFDFNFTAIIKQAIVNNLENAQEKIDAAIAASLQESKPVYISVSCNLPGIPHPTFLQDPMPLFLSPKYFLDHKKYIISQLYFKLYEGKNKKIYFHVTVLFLDPFFFSSYQTQLKSDHDQKYVSLNNSISIFFFSMQIKQSDGSRTRRRGGSRVLEQGNKTSHGWGTKTKTCTGFQFLSRAGGGERLPRRNHAVGERILSGEPPSLHRYLLGHGEHSLLRRDRGILRRLPHRRARFQRLYFGWLLPLA